MSLVYVTHAGIQNISEMDLGKTIQAIVHVCDGMGGKY